MLHLNSRPTSPMYLLYAHLQCTVPDQDKGMYIMYIMYINANS